MDLRSSGQFMKDYRNGIAAIEDLHRLADPGLSPVIGRVHFHLCEIRRKAEQSLEDHPGLRPIKKKIKADFKFLLEEGILSIPHCHQLLMRENKENLNLMQWGRLIETLPLAIEMIRSFPIRGMIDVGYTAKSLRIRTRIESYSELEKIQSAVYKISRKFFNLKILPTFKIEKENQVLFNFDYSHVEDLVYSVHLRKVKVFLSNIFPDYQIPIEKIALIQEQSALILGDDGEFHYFDTLDILSLRRSLNNGVELSLFHFPFLFRPLSIIIPKEGEIAPSDGFFSTGCEKLLTDQAFGKSFKPARKLDLFSLLSK